MNVYKQSLAKTLSHGLELPERRWAVCLRVLYTHCLPRPLGFLPPPTWLAIRLGRLGRLPLGLSVRSHILRAALLFGVWLSES